MAGKKAASVIEALRALLAEQPEKIKISDLSSFKNLASSAYLTSPELHFLHERLAAYSGRLAVLGFVYSDLSIPGPGAVPGAVQLEIPGIYEVDKLTDVAAGFVDAGNGRKFLTIAWGGVHPGTIILRRNLNPECWVEVANYIDRKEPEAAVTCLLLGSQGDQGTPFDAIKKARQSSDRRYWRERNQNVRSSIRDANVQRESGENVSRDT